eukprot:gene25844-biopygen17854
MSRGGYSRPESS